METKTADRALVRPANKREALLERINALKTSNMTAREFYDFNLLLDRSSRLFIQLCWSKLGISREQLAKMGQEDLNELAAIIYEKSKWSGYISNGLLICLPVFGWVALTVLKSARDAPKYNYGRDACWKNMRYCCWYKRIKKSTGNNFQPNVNISADS